MFMITGYVKTALEMGFASLAFYGVFIFPQYDVKSLLLKQGKVQTLFRLFFQILGAVIYAMSRPYYPDMAIIFALIITFSFLRAAINFEKFAEFAVNPVGQIVERALLFIFMIYFIHNIVHDFVIVFF